LNAIACASGDTLAKDEDVLRSTQMDTEAYYVRLRKAQNYSRRAVRLGLRADSRMPQLCGKSMARYGRQSWETPI